MRGVPPVSPFQEVVVVAAACAYPLCPWECDQYPLDQKGAGFGIQVDSAASLLLPLGDFVLCDGSQVSIGETEHIAPSHIDRELL